MPVSEAIDRIEEFPKDGRLWWVRWVDRYFVPQRGTATPWVEVVLSPLHVPLDEIRSLNLKQTVTATEALHPIRLFTGYIPRLALGTVFRDGVEVACLPLQTMRINAEAVHLATHGVMDELSRKPSWWTFPYRVINRRDYYLAGFLKSHAVVVTSERMTIVLPCHEVFRTMYAPDSEIALALTSGPWEMTKTRVLERSETGIRADGRWQIVLRKRIRNEFANVLANLCLNKAGKAGANGIYTALLASDGPGCMKVPMPFDISRLQMEARGIWLDDDPRKFLALQISSMTWPIDVETVYRRQNSGDKGKIQTPIDKPKPYATNGAKPSPDGEGFINANSNEDPSASSASTNFSLPSLRWRNAPKLEKEEKLESFVYVGIPTEDEDHTLAGVSAGTEWHGETSSGSATYSQERRDHSLRFAEVVEMLDRLKAAGEIEQWKCIPHPRPRLVVGGLSVWHFPTKVTGAKKTPGFCYLDRDGKRLRSALVCEIHYRGSTAYWLELEVGQSGGGFRSLVFSVAAPDPTASILLLLNIAALNRGVWPHIDDLVMETGLTWAEFWIHSYIGKAGKGEGGRLNEVRALKVIALAANRAERPLNTRMSA